LIEIEVRNSVAKECGLKESGLRAERKEGIGHHEVLPDHVDRDLPPIQLSMTVRADSMLALKVEVNDVWR
jgi:hypothetical protein